MLLELLSDWILNAFVLGATTGAVPGIHVDGFMAAFTAAFVLGFVSALANKLYCPVFEVLMLPVNVFTRGLFNFFINGLMFWFAGSVLPGFSVDSFWHGLLGAVMYSFFSWGIRLDHHTNTSEKSWKS